MTNPEFPDARSGSPEDDPDTGIEQAAGDVSCGAEAAHSARQQSDYFPFPSAAAEKNQ